MGRGGDLKKDVMELSSLWRRGHGDKGYRKEARQEVTGTESRVALNGTAVEGGKKVQVSVSDSLDMGQEGTVTEMVA